MAEQEEGLLEWLDTPRLVVGALGFFLLGMLVFLLVLWSDQREQVDRIDRIQIERSAEQRAAKKDSVASCFSTANQAPALRRVLLAFEQQAISEEAREALREFRQLNLLNAPTLRECRQLAVKLNIVSPGGIR